LISALTSSNQTQAIATKEGGIGDEQRRQIVVDGGGNSKGEGEGTKTTS